MPWKLLEEKETLEKKTILPVHLDIWITINIILIHYEKFLRVCQTCVPTIAWEIDPILQQFSFFCVEDMKMMNKTKYFVESSFNCRLINIIIHPHSELLSTKEASLLDLPNCEARLTNFTLKLLFFKFEHFRAFIPFWTILLVFVNMNGSKLQLYLQNNMT